MSQTRVKTAFNFVSTYCTNSFKTFIKNFFIVRV